MKKPKATKKPLGRMTSSELAEATAAYGREMAIDGFRPMDQPSRARWERAKRKVGRPRRGKGARVISVSVEQDLLEASDRLAKQLGVSRARLIERGLRTVIASKAR